MTTKRKAAAPRKGAAASRSAAGKAEKAKKAKTNGKVGKTCELDGIVFVLPDSMPETILFDIIEIEAAESSDNPLPLMRFLRSMLERDQFLVLRNHLAGKTPDQVGSAITKMVTGIFGAYGLTPGESRASRAS